MKVEVTRLGGAELERVAGFVFHEADLLDRRQYADWAELFTPDGIYWVPQSREGGDPAREVSIIYDDRTRIGERVDRLLSGDAFAQVPESETLHVVGSLEAMRTDELITVTANVLVAEYRRATQTNHAGRYTFELVEVDGGLRIKMKIVRLVNAAAAFGNLSIIL